MEPLEQPFIYIAFESGSLVNSEGDKRMGMVFQTENRGQREGRGALPPRLKGELGSGSGQPNKEPAGWAMPHLNTGGIPDSFREVLGWGSGSRKIEALRFG